MSAFAFALRSLIRQPARTWLGIGGVAAVGALLFDMLLLSNGLIISMDQMLASAGYDLRASVGTAPPGHGPLIPDADAVAARLRALPQISRVSLVRFSEAVVQRRTRPFAVRILGAARGNTDVWTLVEGRGLQAAGEAVVNARVLDVLQSQLGTTIELRPISDDARSVAPATPVRIVGVAEFPFEGERGLTVGLGLRDVDILEGGKGDRAGEQLLVASADDVPAAVARAAVQQAAPGLTVLTNAQLLVRLQQGGLSYFRQISFVLTTVTTGFAFLLVTVLLTVSVNQRTGELAALRALGFSRRRAVADVFAEAVLLVGGGAVLALPLGLLLANLLDRILKSIPGIPAALHFFVFQPEALAVHVGLFAVTAVAAALYPMRLVATLPIAATLRREVVS